MNKENASKLKNKLISILGDDDSKEIYEDNDFILISQDDDWVFEYRGDFRSVSEESSPFNFTMEGKGKVTKIPKKREDMMITYEGDFVNNNIKKGTWKLTVNDLVEGKYEGEFNKEREFHGEGCLTIYIKDGKVNKKGQRTCGTFAKSKLIKEKNKINNFFNKFFKQ